MHQTSPLPWTNSPNIFETPHFPTGTLPSEYSTTYAPPPISNYNWVAVSIWLAILTQTGRRIRTTAGPRQPTRIVLGTAPSPVNLASRPLSHCPALKPNTRLSPTHARRACGFSIFSLSYTCDPTRRFQSMSIMKAPKRLQRTRSITPVPNISTRCGKPIFP
jgi:hypothetical protein